MQYSVSTSKDGIAAGSGVNTVNPPTVSGVQRSSLMFKSQPKPNVSNVKFEQDAVNTNCISDKPPLFLHVRNISLDVLDSLIEVPEPPPGIGGVAGTASPLLGQSKKSGIPPDPNGTSNPNSNSNLPQFYRGHSIASNSGRARRDGSVTPSTLQNTHTSCQCR